MPILFIRLVIYLSFRIDGKKHDNADGQSAPYAAAGSVATTMETPPTKLMVTLFNPPSALTSKQFLLCRLFLMIRVFI